MRLAVETVVYDPDDLETYPSVCQTPEEVKERFGFTGGELLLFDENGTFLAKLDSMHPNVRDELMAPSHP